MTDDIPAWAIQSACERCGYEGLWEVPEDKLAEVFEMADSLI